MDPLKRHLPPENSRRLRAKVQGASAFALTLALLMPVSTHAQRYAKSVDWPVYGGDADNTHYSTLSQITPANVNRLKVAWRFDTKDDFEGSEMQANPIVIGGVMYATTPQLRVFALDATTGRELWRFDPTNGAMPGPPIRHRGVTVSGNRVLFTYSNKLYELNRVTGRLIQSFGNGGWIDLRAGLGRDANELAVTATTPGVVFRDLFIIGSTVPEALPSAPGDIRAFDVNTGALRWSFHTIPHPGEFGYESWSPTSWKTTGGANAWAGVTVDAKRGMVFAATGSAAFDYYGGNRLGDNLFANSVVALDANTGKRIWHFQTVHHDLWDRDLPAAPSLVTVKRDGKLVDAVAQVSKSGFVYLFERTKGTPLFKIVERPVPHASTLLGEHVSPTQPFPVLPAPFSRQSLSESDLTVLSPRAHDDAVKTFNEYKTGNAFDTPNTSGTIVFPGVSGGAEWGGPAFDKSTGVLYVNSNEMPWLLKLTPQTSTTLYATNCAGCHGDDRKGSTISPSLENVRTQRSRTQVVSLVKNGTGRMPAFGSVLSNEDVNHIADYLISGTDRAPQSLAASPFALPYRSAVLKPFVDEEGYPAIKPPWGKLTAINMNSGATLWSIPFGEYPQLTAKGIPVTGSENYGGAIVTQNGLLIIGATVHDKMLHIFDKRTGRLLWQTKLPAAGNATPAMYMINGRQYIVIACGGGKNHTMSGGTYIAFALPDATPSVANADGARTVSASRRALLRPGLQ